MVLWISVFSIQLYLFALLPSWLSVSQFFAVVVGDETGSCEMMEVEPRGGKIKRNFLFFFFFKYSSSSFSFLFRFRRLFYSCIKEDKKERPEAEGEERGRGYTLSDILLHSLGEELLLVSMKYSKASQSASQLRICRRCSSLSGVFYSKLPSIASFFFFFSLLPPCAAPSPFCLVLVLGRLLLRHFLFTWTRCAYALARSLAIAIICMANDCRSRLMEARPYRPRHGRSTAEATRTHTHRRIGGWFLIEYSSSGVGYEAAASAPAAGADPFLWNSTAFANGFTTRMNEYQQQWPTNRASGRSSWSGSCSRERDRERYLFHYWNSLPSVLENMSHIVLYDDMRITSTTADDDHHTIDWNVRPE